MVISSANFGIYVAAWKRGFHVLRENTEFKIYLSIVVSATLLISLNLMLENSLSAPFRTTGSALYLGVSFVHHGIYFLRL